jgi:hypothetical protein
MFAVGRCTFPMLLIRMASLASSFKEAESRSLGCTCHWLLISSTKNECYKYCHLQLQCLIVSYTCHKISLYSTTGCGLWILIWFWLCCIVNSDNKAQENWSKCPTPPWDTPWDAATSTCKAATLVTTVTTTVPPSGNPPCTGTEGTGSPSLRFQFWRLLDSLAVSLGSLLL